MPRGNPGKIIKLADNRHCIVYNKQPLLGKVILNLLHEDLSLMVGDDKKPKILIKERGVFNEEMKGAKLIGYVD